MWVYVCLCVCVCTGARICVTVRVNIHVCTVSEYMCYYIKDHISRQFTAIELVLRSTAQLIV